MTIGGHALSSAPLAGAPVTALVDPVSCYLAVASPLGAAAAVVLHDFSANLGDALTCYVVDLVTPGGAVRVPVSSWQATLQTGSSNYVQCVIPACLDWVDAINSATEFVVWRRAVLPGTTAIEYEMARAPLERAQYDRGAQRYTCTVSGYSDAFAEDLDPPEAYDRTLAGVRTISSGEGGMRVRCAIDWLLRPGHRAVADGVEFVASYINYYAPASGDAYMDAGSRV